MVNSKRVLFFLATEKGYNVLQMLLHNGYSENIAAIVSFHEIGMQRDYFDDIHEICLQNSLTFYEWKDIKDSIELVIREIKVTSCVAISWRYLLPLSINKYLEDRLIILHDSLLPRYRGFAPLVTALLNGDNEVGVSVLYAEEKADCGDIILQKAIQVKPNSYISDVVDQVAEVYAKAVMELMNRLICGNILAMPQDHENATHSIWRDEDDYWINWKWSAQKINRHIHALGYPYKCAKTSINESIIRIQKSEVVKDVTFEIRMPGKIWEIKDNHPIIVCGDGMIRILEATDEQGKTYKFTKLRSRMGGYYSVE